MALEIINNDKLFEGLKKTFCGPPNTPVIKNLFLLDPPWVDGEEMGRRRGDGGSIGRGGGEGERRRRGKKERKKR